MKFGLLTQVTSNVAWKKCHRSAFQKLFFIKSERLSLFCIYEYIEPQLPRLEKRNVISIDPKGINLEVKASLFLESQQLSQPSLIENAKDFFRTIEQTFVSRAKNAEPNSSKDKVNSVIFSDFLKKLGAVLLKYDDDHLKNFANVLHRAMENRYQTVIYNPVLFNRQFKAILMDKLSKWKSTDPKQLKDEINYYVNNKAEKDIEEIVDNVNKYFNDEDLEYLDDILDRIAKNENNNKKLNEVLKDALNFVMFERYENLNDKSKLQFANALRGLSVKSEDNNNFDFLGIFRNAVANLFRRSLAILPHTNNSLALPDELKLNNKTMHPLAKTINNATGNNNTSSFKDTISNNLFSDEKNTNDINHTETTAQLSSRLTKTLNKQ